ncbi:hypothetical protein BpHYR1_048073 [Brachionus plicatilis]|uniref:Uncharacterized protein n=1 Tax=Brachionus plicatilis TaxID=10195 RepID=A0A3M7Q0M9_BRAPC|nr:hypothetical protein BpHYR1_048073 [Brachionus plicatilis]
MPLNFENLNLKSDIVNKKEIIFFLQLKWRTNCTIWNAIFLGKIIDGRPKCKANLKTNGHFGGQTRSVAENFRKKYCYEKLFQRPKN